MRGARFQGLLWLPVLLLALYMLALGAVRSAGMLALPYQAEYGEGPVLDWAYQIINGALPYKPIADPPYNFSVYTPLYMALSGVMIPLLPANPYFGGRLLSLLSAAGLALLLWHILTRDGNNADTQTRRAARMAALVALALWWVSPYVLRWSTYLRPDMLALFWSIAGVALLAPAGRGQSLSMRRLALAALLFVLAFFTKQSFFAAPLAALLFLAFAGHWRATFSLMVLGALTGGAVTLLLYALAGSALIENLIAANANPFSWEAVRRFWWSFITIAPVVMGLAALALSRRAHRLWVLYLLLAVVVSLSIGKAGAWENYFLEPLWLLCLLAGLTLRHFLGAWQGSGRIAMIALLVVFQLALYTRGYERTHIADELRRLDEIRAEGAALRAALNKIPADTPVYSEQMGALAEVGRTVPLHSFVYTQLARQGLWDESALNYQLAAGDGIVIQRYDAVGDPLEMHRYTRGMLDAIERGYGLGERVGEWLIRTSDRESHFYHPDQSMALDNGITLLNWEAHICDTAQSCESGARPVTLRSGGTLVIQSLWQTSDGVRVPLALSTKLYDGAGQLVTQQDGAFRNGWMGKGWAANAVVRDAPRTLVLPADLPTGGYTLELSLYEQASGAPLAVARLPYFKVASDTTPPLPPVSGLEAEFGAYWTLIGHSELPARLRPGDILNVEMTYQAQEWQGARYTTFLHLVAPDGTVAAQTDFEPAYPPYLWGRGEQLSIPYQVSIPAELAAGEYALVAGWYDSATFARLPVSSGGDSVTIATVAITE